MSMATHLEGLARIEQQHFTRGAATEGTVKRHHRRSGAGAETGEVGIRPEIGADFSCPGGGSPDIFEFIGFRCIRHPGVGFKLLFYSPRRLSGQGMPIHHMRIGEQPQKSQFRNPAEHEQVRTERLKLTFGELMVRVSVNREGYPYVSVRQVDHQNQRSLGSAFSPCPCGSEAKLGAWPPGEELS